MVERCYVAASLDEALKIRKEAGAHVLAGGTDLMCSSDRGPESVLFSLSL